VGSKTLIIQIGARRACGAVIESSIGSLHVTQIVDRPSVEEGLGALAAFGPFDRVVASLPAEDAAFRILTLPFHDRRRIAQAVGPALEEHVPLSLDEAAVAWDYSGPQRSGDVIAAMAPIARIEEVRARIEAAVGQPRRLLWTPSVVLAAYRQAMGENASFVALDVGPDGAIVASVQEGALRALRMVAPCELDLMKRNVVWSVRTIAAPGDRIVIGGPWASRLGTMLEKELTDLRLEPLPAASPVAGFGDRDWRELTAVAGLVLAAAGEHAPPSIDFTPAGGGLLGIRSLSELPDEARPVLRWGAAALALLALSIGLDYFELISQRNAVADRAEEIYVTAMPSGSGGTGRKLKMEMRLNELTTRAGSIGTGASASPLQVMAVLSQSVPKSLAVELSQLELLPPNVKISGNAESFEAVTKLQEALRKSGSFNRVDVREVHAAVSGGGVDFLLDLGIGEGEPRATATEARTTAPAPAARETAPPPSPPPSPDAAAAGDDAGGEEAADAAPKDAAKVDDNPRRDGGERSAKAAAKAAAKKEAKLAAKTALKAERQAQREAEKKVRAEAKARKKAERAAVGKKPRQGKTGGAKDARSDKPRPARPRADKATDGRDGGSIRDAGGDA